MNCTFHFIKTVLPSRLSSALWVLLLAGFGTPVFGQIEIPSDAPQPLTPAASAESVSLPDGFSLELLAAEPLIRNPSGVCWDERGRLFVCELHGYNLEGQYDVEELNKTGELDRVVRRIPAPKEAMEKAEREQTGSVKRLMDTDGDGVMDKSEVWADDLPACFGIIPARGGVIVVCAPHIVYLADLDNDGVAEIRQTLFSGFHMGVLERRMSAPQWGIDDWVYVAGGGGTITGPNLAAPVELPRNDFRFKADGSAIEPLPAGTWTFGFTFSDSGDRYVISTGSPAIYEAPLPWRYLRRNPHVGFGRMTVDVGPGQQTYPTSKPHPWRSRRAEDPGFEELYRTRYGAAESTPNGFFTSACSPLVYKDTALPLAGQLLACEPAQNMIHRSIISRDGLVPKLARPESEQQSEFLASTDVWFHPIAMSHAPDGAIVIADFYREIIEDYSAIPRYLQQQYQLKHGENHGRLWRLVHRDMPKAEAAELSGLASADLVAELQSERFWRRQTAKRLLIERQDSSVASQLQSIDFKRSATPSVIAALYVLDSINQLRTSDLALALQHADPAVVVQTLRLADTRLDDPELVNRMLTLVNESDERLLLQLALSLGEAKDRRAVRSLAMLAMQSIDVRWMADAILSSLDSSGADVMSALFQYMDSEQPSKSGTEFFTRLAKMLADSRDDEAISRVLVAMFTESDNAGLQHACIVGLKQGFNNRRRVDLATIAERELRAACQHNDPQIAAAARFLVVAMKRESADERLERLRTTSEQVADVQLPIEQRVAAVKSLAEEQEHESIRYLFRSFGHSTPAVRAAILNAVLERSEYQSLILSAIEAGQLPASALSAVQREVFLKHDDSAIRDQAKKIFDQTANVDPRLVAQFTAALSEKRDLARGKAVFKKLCSNCHKVRQIGFEVGPDLISEFGRSEQTFVQDILAPATKITPGYETYLVQTVDGVVVTGLVCSESPTSITLRKEEGKEQIILRKDIEAIKVSDISLMPDDLVKALTPTDLANVIAWLRGADQSRDGE